MAQDQQRPQFLPNSWVLKRVPSEKTVPIRGTGAEDMRFLIPLRRAKTGRNHKHLIGIAAARLWLHMADLFEVLLKRRQKARLCAAAQHFGDKATAFHENGCRKVHRCFAERHGAPMIGLAVPGGVGRHIGKNEISRPAEMRLQTVRRVAIHEIHLDDLDTRNWIDRQPIYGDDAAFSRSTWIH